MKVAWRNPTIHVATTHTVESAEAVFDAARTLMNYLSEQLRERKPKGTVRMSETVH